MSNELTYILGAGASFQSIPVVKNFPMRFSSFSSYLSRTSNNTSFDENKREAFILAHQKAQEICDAFRAHQSFDTYFKKLFHTSQLRKIAEAKKILNLYFIWEYLSRPTAKPDIYDETIFWKQSAIDKRYDALVAGLLKPKAGKSEPYCPINFITWNYDMNLFMSLKNYFSPNKLFGDFLSTIDKKNNLWQIEDKISIINMNGYSYCTKFSPFKSMNDLTSVKKEIYEWIYEKITDRYFSQDYSDKDSESIKFAWELTSGSKTSDLECIKQAREKISRSANIVVIGYTFPLYNRLVDYEYFNNLTVGGKRISIQDPNAIQIKKSLASDFNISSENSPIFYVDEITNCDSFFVPSNIYKYADSTDGLD